jgi:predicted HAD superfamily phosphohydrolase YqeG
MKPSPCRVREAVGLLDAEHSECVLVGDSTTDVLAGRAGRSVVRQQLPHEPVVLALT